MASKALQSSGRPARKNPQISAIQFVQDEDTASRAGNLYRAMAMAIPLAALFWLVSALAIMAILR